MRWRIVLKWEEAVQAELFKILHVQSTGQLDPQSQSQLANCKDDCVCCFRPCSGLGTAPPPWRQRMQQQRRWLLPARSQKMA